MIMRKRINLSIILMLASSFLMAAPEHSPWPGGIAIVPIDGDTRPVVTVGGGPAVVTRTDSGWLAVIGIPLDHEAELPLIATVSRHGQDD